MSIGDKPAIIDLSDGKYTIIKESTGKLTTLRYGELWQEDELIGDNLVYALVCKIEDLQTEVDVLKGEPLISDRYKVIEESKTSRCCFSHSVIDTTKRNIGAAKQTENKG